MELDRHYRPQAEEPALQARWDRQGVYHFDRGRSGPVYAIDTPPPTVSGALHLGHVFSYSHADFLARYRRMRGYNVYYPMGYDDNGLPTERLVERRDGIRASEVGRLAFIARCQAVSEAAEADYQALWQRLGLSVDWRYTYRTSDITSRRLAQWSFLDLHRQGLVYRDRAPAIWCPECQTSIAQAEIDDWSREGEILTLSFALTGGRSLPIATTRPELLPACVAVFVHPADARYQELPGQTAIVPWFGQQVPILADPAADPALGTGAVMCCTFGDTTDVAWWRQHQLPFVEAIDARGRLAPDARELAGLTISRARAAIVAILTDRGKVLERRPVAQTIGVHERCDTPVEYRLVEQWFVRVLAFKDDLLRLGEQVRWHPAHMRARYRHWVENLAWDWCISRQRTFGVPLPLWTCQECGAELLAEESRLPLDPADALPGRSCPACGGDDFRPEGDVMDTWFTSSLSPQIAAELLRAPENRSLPPMNQLAPYALRPQAHEIIRTWAFYTLVKSRHHFGALPWTDIALSGWGLAPEGGTKISKSKGSGPVSPEVMLGRYSADAVRYWAAGTGLGKDARIDEERIKAGQRLATKLWHVARFAAQFSFGAGSLSAEFPVPIDQLTLADRWLLARLQLVVSRSTAYLDDFDYAAARNETEQFFWRDLADNYLEMAKQRLYARAGLGAPFVLHRSLATIIRLLAPFMPFVTEHVFLTLYASTGQESLHRASWPVPDSLWTDDRALTGGELLLAMATATRRYKSDHGLALNAPLARLTVFHPDPTLRRLLASGIPDLAGMSRAETVVIASEAESAPGQKLDAGPVQLIVSPPRSNRAPESDGRRHQSA